ncbi:unnamed protein product [Rotaria sp. Silwood2]|nr:unnamed protein product [Rotaria sp. Silwood2]
MPPWPRDIFVTKKHIYVAESGSFRVLRLSKKGTNAVAVVGVMNEPANFFDVTDSTKIGLEVVLFVDNNENLYVSDTINGKVLWFPSNSTSGFPGVIVAGSTMPGEDSSHLAFPHGIFVSEIGTIYVADAGNNRIQRWEKGSFFGVTVAGTGKPGSNLNELKFPTDVVVDSKGYMYIVDAQNNRVLRWQPDSVYGECIVACTGSFGNHPHMLKMPTSMAFDSYGSLFIVDSLNFRIQKFQIFEKFDQYTTPRATKPTKTSATKSTTTETTSITTTKKLMTTGRITSPTTTTKTVVIGTTSTTTTETKSITTTKKLMTTGPITSPTTTTKTVVIGTTSSTTTTTETKSITTTTKLMTTWPITSPTTPTKTVVIGTTSTTTTAKSTTMQTISVGCDVRSMKINISIVVLILLFFDHRSLIDFVLVILTTH